MNKCEWITAGNAKGMTDNIVNTESNKFISDVFEKFIHPAIKNGKYECTVSVSERDGNFGYLYNRTIPESVITKLIELGYDVTYGQTCFDQRDGYEIDKSKLVISWK